MRALTPAEQRGLLLVAVLYLGGGAWDMWRTLRPSPRWHDEPTGTPAPGVAPVAPRSPGPPASGARPLQLNRASERELDALPGIGPVLAHRIVEHRARHGPFRSPGELRAVPGIGPSLIARLEGRVATDSL